MRKQTDLAAMKQLARVFLMMDPEPTSFSPVIIKHPFTDSGIVTVRSGNEYRAADITADEAVRSQWREQMASLIENAETPRHIYMMLTKSYRFAFLKYAMPYFSQKDFSEYLANAWVMCESPNNDPNFTQKQMLGLFKKADPQVLMDEDEYKQFQALEDTLVVYRGVTSYNANRVKALSWTLDREKAEWFAHRFDEDGAVYEAKIDKAHVYAFFSSRNESEVIVDPAFLNELAEVQTDVFHPITAQARTELYDKVLEAYEQKLEEGQEQDEGEEVSEEADQGMEQSM